LTYTTITNNGASSNRIDIVFMGDGYTQSEIDTTYRSQVNSFLQYIFQDAALTDPFYTYRNYFNVHVIDVVSAQSGADDPVNDITRNTALNSTYLFDGITDRLLSVDETAADAELANGLSGAGFEAEIRFVAINSSKYGGAGGYYATFAAGNSAAYEVALHELGHSFIDLADEYLNGGPALYTGGEPDSLNLTIDDTGQKWSHWLGYEDPVLGTVGTYEGGGYSSFGIYRPTDSSKMKDLNRPFDPIAKESFVREFYNFVDPLDNWTGKSGSTDLANPGSISARAVDENVIAFEWLIDDVAVGSDQDTLNIAALRLDDGDYTVVLRAYDDTGYVRIGQEDTEQVVSWRVSIDGEVEPDTGGRSDFNADGYDDILFYNATSNGVGQFNMPGGDWSAIGSAGQGWEAVALGQFDSDDFSTDILWFNASTGGIGRFDMDLGVNAGWSGIGRAGAGWTVVGAGDFNGDGTDDLLWYNAASGSVGQLRLSDSGNQWIGLGKAGAGWEIAGTADFNGDGIDDILWANTASGGLGQYRMTADGKTWSTIVTMGAGYEVVGTGDFYGSNDPEDILVFNDTTGVVGFFDLYQLENQDTVEWANLGQAGAGWQITGTGDFDGSGTDDILWRHNDGSLGQFSFPGGTSPHSWQAIGSAGADWDVVL